MEHKEVTSEVIAKMRAEYKNGASQGEIAKIYNDSGYRSVRGAKLNQSIVSSFIRSKAGYKRSPTKAQKSNQGTEGLFLEILTSPILSDAKKVNTLISLME